MRTAVWTLSASLVTFLSGCCTLFDIGCGHVDPGDPKSVKAFAERVERESNLATTAVIVLHPDIKESGLREAFGRIQVAVAQDPKNAMGSNLDALVKKEIAAAIPNENLRARVEPAVGAVTGIVRKQLTAFTGDPADPTLAAGLQTVTVAIFKGASDAFGNGSGTVSVSGTGSGNGTGTTPSDQPPAGNGG